MDEMVLSPQVTGPTEPMVLVLMGVAGSGKTTVAALLAGRLGWRFEEGDALHPQANIEKMAAGRPLTDEDRWPWLARVADWIDERLDAGQNGLITSSALKRSATSCRRACWTASLRTFRNRSRMSPPSGSTSAGPPPCLPTKSSRSSSSAQQDADD